MLCQANLNYHCNFCSKKFQDVAGYQVFYLQKSVKFFSSSLKKKTFLMRFACPGKFDVFLQRNHFRKKHCLLDPCVLCFYIQIPQKIRHMFQNSLKRICPQPARQNDVIWTLLLRHNHKMTSLQRHCDVIVLAGSRKKMKNRYCIKIARWMLLKLQQRLIQFQQRNCVCLFLNHSNARQRKKIQTFNILIEFFNWVEV